MYICEVNVQKFKEFLTTHTENGNIAWSQDAQITEGCFCVFEADVVGGKRIRYQMQVLKTTEGYNFLVSQVDGNKGNLIYNEKCDEVFAVMALESRTRAFEEITPLIVDASGFNKIKKLKTIQIAGVGH